jgi:tetratricopeptide (TPR) repeat protein
VFRNSDPWPALNKRSVRKLTETRMLTTALVTFVLLTLWAPGAGASFLGIQILDYSSTEEPHAGVRVVGVNKGSPADRSGMKPEDILVDANGVPLRSAKTLADLIKSMKAGDSLRLRAWRRGNYVTLTVVSAEMPQSLAHLEEGRRLHGKRDFEGAIHEYTKALTLDPANTEAALRRGWAYLGKEDYGRAIVDANEVLARTQNAEAFLVRGICHVHFREHDRAYADFAEALRFNPLLFAAYNNRAALHFARGDVAAALDDVRHSLEIDPANTYALELQARINAWQGRKGTGGDRGPSEKSGKDEARRGGEPATKLREDGTRNEKERGAKSRLDLGLAEARKGNYNDAISQYSAGIALNTRYNAPLLYNRGISYEKQGDHSRAIADYTEAVRLNPRFAEAYLRRGVMYAHKLGDYGRAERDWNTVIKIEPSGSAAKKARENLKKLRDMKKGGLP